MNLIEELLKQFAEKSGQNKPLLPGQPAGGTPPFVPMRNPGITPQPQPNPRPPTQPSLAGTSFGIEKSKLKEITPNISTKHMNEVQPQGAQHAHEVTVPGRDLKTIQSEYNPSQMITPEQLGDGIKAPDRGDPKQKWFKTPFHKDNDRMAMMFSALSDGFGGMTMSGKSGMAAINKANYAKGMEGVQNNKTMRYLIDNKPELARKLMEIAPEHRGQFMEQAMKSQFEGAGKQSAFAEKVSMIMSANPGMTQADAIKQAQSPSSVTNINTGDMGGGAKPFQEALGTQAAEWYKKRGNALSNINDLERVVGTIETAIENGDQLSGGIINFMPDDVQDLFNPQGQDVRRSVEKVIQSSLKETLGAQFAQKEGQQVFERTWNAKAPIEYNLRRTRQLLSELQTYASSQDALLDGMKSSNGNILQYMRDNPEASAGGTSDDIRYLQYDDPLDAGVNPDPASSSPVARPSWVSEEDWNLLTDEERADPIWQQ